MIQNASDGFGLGRDILALVKKCCTLCWRGSIIFRAMVKKCCVNGGLWGVEYIQLSE
jgi:hypothetical protein